MSPVAMRPFLTLCRWSVTIIRGPLQLEASSGDMIMTCLEQLTRPSGPIPNLAMKKELSMWPSVRVFSSEAYGRMRVLRSLQTFGLLGDFRLISCLSQYFSYRTILLLLLLRYRLWIGTPVAWLPRVKKYCTISLYCLILGLREIRHKLVMNSVAPHERLVNVMWTPNPLTPFFKKSV